MQKNAITGVSELVVKMMTLYNDRIKLPNSCEEKILGVIIDNELNFDPHIRSKRKKAAQKLLVLNEISSSLVP